MIKQQVDGLTYYRFELPAFDRVAHGVFARYGGVSPAPFDTLNLAFVPGDDPVNVNANLSRAGQALGFSRLAYAGQVHGHRALTVSADNWRQASRPEEVTRGYDAIITRDSGLGLLVKLADCQGALLSDPRTQVVAVVHSGWRGSVHNILGRTVARLASEFGVNPSDLVAGIGPSLGPCCAEFVNYRLELPEAFWKYRFAGDRFDFWEISRNQLTEAGLRPENIEISGMCTVCGNEGFYSYRREKVTGRFGLIAGRV